MLSVAWSHVLQKEKEVEDEKLRTGVEHSHWFIYTLCMSWPYLERISGIMKPERHPPFDQTCGYLWCCPFESDDGGQQSLGDTWGNTSQFWGAHFSRAAPPYACSPWKPASALHYHSPFGHWAEEAKARIDEWSSMYFQRIDGVFHGCVNLGDTKRCKAMCPHAKDCLTNCNPLQV